MIDNDFTKPCKHFMKGFCKFNEKCNFIHNHNFVKILYG